MRARFRYGPDGFTVLEVLVALGLVVVIVVTVANLIIAIQRLQTSGDFRTRALGYAQQSIELVTGAQRQLFGCTCPNGGCTTSTCTASDGQSCTVLPGYNGANFYACWTTHARDLASGPDLSLHLVLNGSTWQLKSGQETGVCSNNQNNLCSIDSDCGTGNTCSLTKAVYTREVDLQNLSDSNQKQVTVVVGWKENGKQNNISLSTVLTAWHN